MFAPCKRAPNCFRLTGKRGRRKNVDDIHSCCVCRDACRPSRYARAVWTGRRAVHISNKRQSHPLSVDLCRISHCPSGRNWDIRSVVTREGLYDYNCRRFAYLDAALLVREGGVWTIAPYNNKVAIGFISCKVLPVFITE
ncbi:hypothetical protein GTNG_1544 [Geobacillus thermodenitrificans NG80-2]|uniref:Uncharacterized protein n=1 Tax=Geobacillus thermodenitrificans (strain NG80-2) TaxID=420246 RepID=A4INK8_GEOTN|nr:hypothetical protein GTNG_1544 [Geobacillus thermodenitrificans NG80-2]